MKRLFAFAVTVLTAVVLCSCTAVGGGDSNKPNCLDESFQAAVSIVLDDLNAEGTVTRTGSGNWEIEFSSPNTLSGVKLAFSEGNVTASYKGLNFSVPQTALPVKAMMSNLIAAVDDHAANEQLTGTEKDGMLEISGSLDGGEYTLFTDGNGRLAAFEMPNNKLKMTFSDVTSLKPSADSEATTTSAVSAPASETATTTSSATTTAQ